VDPSPAGETTLTYVASNVHGERTCPDHLDTPCSRDVLERVNYSTGETERLYSRFVNYTGSSQIHDIDRLSESRYLVGDIKFDRVFVVNVETNDVEWTWNVSSAYDRSTGGKPGDWTHLNDVEALSEELFMVNLRNQDQVVFVHRERGLLENWTLGAEDDYDTLYEPHNPDYIPAENGGPAILIADSENNRVVEYQRRNGSWERTWEWTDETLQWPRDADRLPNDNTLIVDTHGTRILEVRPNGTIARERAVPRGVYDVELLSTGPESAGGHSMVRIRDETDETDVSSVQGTGRVQKAFLDLFPALVLHGFLFVLPTWVSPVAGALLLLDLAIGVLWIVGEGVRFAVVWRRGE
ncbi:MAG: arylsulfotransferase (asst), partial [Halanaeroarchaeum sp.]